MSVYGADVSEFQSSLPDGDFIIIRAHSGYRTDKLFAQHWAEAKGRYRLGRGVYGYVVPGDGAAQAQAVIDLVASDPPELGYWSDIEQAGLSHETATAHIDRLRSTGKAGFYSNVPDYRGTLGSDPALDDLPWWVAGYGPNDGNEHPMNPAAPRPYLIHQFTSRWQGGSLDGNVADETALVAAFGGAPAPGPVVEDYEIGAVYEAPDGQWWFCREAVRTPIPTEDRDASLFVLVGTKQAANGEVPKVSAEFLHLWKVQP